MKGYYTNYSYFGYVGGQYIQFATETDYKEFLEAQREIWRQNMYFKIKEHRLDNGQVKETYINTKLDIDTVYEVAEAIDACYDFTLYKCFRAAYTKAWNKLLDLLETETDNRKAVNHISIIMSRARLEAS